jgi:hypothetical protein
MVGSVSVAASGCGQQNVSCPSKAGIATPAQFQPIGLSRKIHTEMLKSLGKGWRMSYGGRNNFLLKATVQDFLTVRKEGERQV